MFKNTGNYIESYNPATKEYLGRVGITTEQEIKEMVIKCREAFQVWKNYSYEERANCMIKLADYLEQKKDDLAVLMTKEMGRPLTESIPEVTKACKFIRHYAENAEKMLEEQPIMGVANKQVKLVYEPYGVVALIKPWNMSLQTPIWAMAPALMSGNAVILKASENTLLVAKELEKAISYCEFPKDLIAFVYGDKKQGECLVSQSIDMISFTGSVVAGKEIAKKTSDRFIKTSLELGGKDAMIVLDDVNIDFAAMAAVWGSTTNCGQFCSSIERIYVKDTIFDIFVDKCVNLCKSINVGNGLIEGVEMGPVVNEIQYNKILKQISDATNQGATILCGGIPNDTELSNGWFIKPTVIVNLTHDMEIMRTETFGPIVKIMKFSNIDEAIELANDSDYGLGFSVITQNPSIAEEISKKVEAGMIWINEPLLSNENCPWIPMKNSGIGYELGELGLKEFVKVKLISTQYEDNNSYRSWWYMKDFR